MIENAAQARVTVFGESFTLLSDEQIELVEKAAQRVDELMNQFAHGVRIPDAKRLAMLAAIQLAHDLQKRELAHQDFTSSVQALVATVANEISC
ncbi:MAG: hypothetical protein UV79_C0009G0005 [candidate division TM6 bacterium GW2011_GWF2_43_17]|nr:MAG: hypothetical protein UV79_C0009G0005 [candidate division TM6 bacterium GW2011_GWF2_43_17]HAU30396.1 hypothetical protein [Candidatus Dependentiae bacterium]